jgi:hypothetical protein
MAKSFISFVARPGRYSDWLRAGRPGFDSRQGQDFYFYSGHTGSGAHPASYPMGAVVKRPGREADHSPPTSAEVKNTWIYTSTPPYAFMAS